MKIKKILLSFGLLLGISSGIIINGSTVNASEVGYSVIPQPSEKQLDTKNTYYDLKLSPGESDLLKVTVKNNSDKEITIDASVDRATTNSNGVVEYKNSDKHQSVALKNDLNDLVKVSDNKIKLEPNEAKDVTFQVTQPKEIYDGVIAGGINFTQEDTDDTENSSSKSSMAIHNQYSYSIALVLHGEKELTKHEVTGGDVEVKQSNGRNNIYFPINNETAAFLNKVNVTGEVSKKGDNKAVYSEKMKDAQVAPNSSYEYPIGTNQTELRPGKYTAKVSVESKGEKWSFTKDFEITKEKAKDLNETAVIKKKDYTLYILIGAGIVLLILLLVFVLWYAKRKNKEIEELKNIYQEENEKK